MKNIFEPRFRLCFISLLLFAVVTFFFQPIVAAAELLIAVFVFVHFRYTMLKRNKEMLARMESVMDEVTASTKDTLMKFPLPITLVKMDSNEIKKTCDFLNFIKLYPP